MGKAIETESGVPDEEIPQFTAEEMRRSLRFPDLPAGLQAIALAGRKHVSSTTSVSERPAGFRLSPDVKAALRATGSGWQTRANDVLRSYFVEGKQEGRQ